MVKPYSKMSTSEKQEIRDKLWQAGIGLTKQDSGKEDKKIKALKNKT